MIKELIKSRKLGNEEGFSLLELVVAVGILLVLTVGGLLAYNGITKNAREAAVQSAADEVLTGAVAADINNESVVEVGEKWNNSSSKNKDGKASIIVQSDKVGECIVVKARNSGGQMNLHSGDCDNLLENEIPEWRTEL